MPGVIEKHTVDFTPRMFQRLVMHSDAEPLDICMATDDMSKIIVSVYEEHSNTYTGGKTVELMVVPTGSTSIPDDAWYLKTVYNGAIAWHIYCTSANFVYGRHHG